MRLRFIEECRNDLLDTLRFIDAQGAVRGARFRDELRKCIKDIKDNPESWPRVYKNVRLRIMKKFGFGIYYEYDGPTKYCLVGAIVHLKRHSGSWKRRFEK